jgi:hypothetical protein
MAASLALLVGFAGWGLAVYMTGQLLVRPWQWCVAQVIASAAALPLIVETGDELAVAGAMVGSLVGNQLFTWVAPYAPFDHVWGALCTAAVGDIFFVWASKPQSRARVADLFCCGKRPRR